MASKAKRNVACVQISIFSLLSKKLKNAVTYFFPTPGVHKIISLD